MKNYREKFIYLTSRNGWHCPIGKEKYGRMDKVEDMHHKIAHDTKRNRKKYPLFIDSLLNLELVNHDNHLNNPSWGCVKNPDMVAEKYERFLERHPKISSFVNGETL